MHDSAPAITGPLSGITVIEVASFIAGPYVAMLLADLGAQVIKLEVPGSGDPFREWGEDRGASPQFAAFNRNKRSVECDLKSDAGRRLLSRLLAGADVLVENMRPGKMAALGLGYDELHQAHPRLIYCSVTGMGPTGPASQQPAYDAIVQARSGLWSLFTSREAPEAIGPALSDQIAGLFAVQGVLAALVFRDRAGVGQLVEANMLAASAAFLTAPIAEYTMTGTVDGPYTRAHRSQSFAFVTRDGLPLAVHLSSPPKFWTGLLTAVGAVHLANDERFKDKSSRVLHYEELRAILAEIFVTKDRDEWLDLLWRQDVPAAPIQDVGEALRDPQILHQGLLREFGRGADAVTLVGCPVTFSASPCLSAEPVPPLGSHNQQYDMAAEDVP
jgi:crotonobetainyl-CoA:carnitine CoA-transferase CaiB-like acyl-CoA transferase